MRATVSVTFGAYRQHSPDTTARFFFFASSQVAATSCTRGTSVATGFSTKACLPFSIAYLRCSERKWGGVVRIAFHHVCRGARTTLAATDQAVFERLVGARMHKSWHAHRGQRRRGRRG